MIGGVSLILHANSTDYVPLLRSNFLDEGFAIRLLYDHLEVGSFISIAPGFHSWIGMQVMENRVPHGMIPSPFKPPCTDHPTLNAIDLESNKYRCNMAYDSGDGSDTYWLIYQLATNIER